MFRIRTFNKKSAIKETHKSIKTIRKININLIV